MKAKGNDVFDAIIIGAGMGGLVCGCYLAKAGMKVLIAEQHYKAGGYCTSFKRKNSVFDAAAHSFGSYREDGIVRKIFRDLEIDKRIKITRYYPSDIIRTPDHEIIFGTDIDETAHNLETSLPEGRHGFKGFLRFIWHADSRSFALMRNWTFKDLLDRHFRDERVKAVLSFPVFGNGGLPPSRMSAYVGTTIFKEFLLDGGYYPEGGMQRLPDVLAERFKEFGGELRLSTPVRQIVAANDRVKGVVLENDGFVSSRYVVSNCDARQTFLSLLGKDEVKEDFLYSIERMEPSLSMFILYLGVDGHISTLLKPGVNLWSMSHYDLDKTYDSLRGGNFDSIGVNIVRLIPQSNNVLALILAPFKDKQYWDINKNSLAESFITELSGSVLHGLSKHIKHKEAATPYTLHRYTLNFNGAAYGWATSPSQLAIPDFKSPSFIHNLYLTGHWTTLGMGIPGVVYLGLNTAHLLIKKASRPKTSITGFR
jgi:phytoene dehydrogenase-like protein